MPDAGGLWPRRDGLIDALLPLLGRELEAAARVAEDLGGALCGDPDVAFRHMESLQSLDLLAQTLAETARLLDGPEPVEARLAAVRLEALNARLAHGLRRE